MGDCSRLIRMFWKKNKQKDGALKTIVLDTDYCLEPPLLFVDRSAGL